MKFLRSLFGVAKAHPLASVLFLFVVVLTLGGVVWWVIGAGVGAIRKVSPKAGDTVANAVGKVASATKSA